MKIRRQGQIVPHHNQGAGGFLIFLGNVSNHPNLNRIIQIGMDIEQHIDAVAQGVVNVA